MLGNTGGVRGQTADDAPHAYVLGRGDDSVLVSDVLR